MRDPIIRAILAGTLVAMVGTLAYRCGEEAPMRDQGCHRVDWWDRHSDWLCPTPTPGATR